LSDTIKALCWKFQPEEECKSSDEVISAAETVIAKLSVEQKETEDGKELVALVGVMAELRETKEEVERLIERKNNPEPAATGNAPVEEMDPMQAMINSLVAACAIPEEELAKMDKMEQEQQAQNGNGNSNSNTGAPKEGVTTIGFGNQHDDGDDEVQEVMVVKTKRRKRNLQQAGIEDVEEEAKKMKLNTGTAKKTESAKGDEAATV